MIKTANWANWRLCLSALSYEVLLSKPRNRGKGGRQDHCPQGTSQGPTQGRSIAFLATAGAKLGWEEDSGAATQPNKLVEMLKRLHKEDAVMYNFNYALMTLSFCYLISLLKTFSHIHNSQIQSPTEQFINNLMHNKAPILLKAAVLEWGHWKLSQHLILSCHTTSTALRG